jgi:glycosyltransferase involved in cell wall biosynthesis
MGGFTDTIIRGHLRYTQPDLLITLFDLWPLRDTEIPGWIRQSHTRWLAWFPIDATPISWGNLEVLHNVDYPVAMANFAEEELRKEAPDFKVAVIPHGVEKDWAFTTNGRKEFRRSIQVPDDAFLFGTVGRNAYYPGRKGFDRLIRAFGEANLPNTHLYIHAGTWSESGSIPIGTLLDFFERLYPGISEKVHTGDEYNLVMGYSQEGMNAMYSAFDCYVQPTLGEGFGIPVMEAQACGCAVIATDCTSMPELVAPNSSVLVPGATEIFTPDPSLRTLIDIPKLAEAMREIYDIKQNDLDGYLAMKGTAGQWANGWDWDAIWQKHWQPLLAKIEEEISLSPPSDWHRGGAVIFEHEGRMRMQESFLKSPVVAKVLALREQLDHPNLVPILATGQTEDGLHWFEMPLLTPLREVDLDALTPAQADRILEGVRNALVYMHEQGKAHRDVSPENILVDVDFNPYLTDFEWAHPCDGVIGESCVDFEPWAVPDKCVPIVQVGLEPRGYHTIVNYVRRLPLENKTHGFAGVPYQSIDGVGERDCEGRWRVMKPDVRGRRVIDLGCNLGWFVRRSLEEGASEAVGLDFDQAVVESARALGPGAYRVHDLEKDPRPAGNYDVAFALSVLQHIKNPDDVLAWLLENADEIYIEQPYRFISDFMAETLKDADFLGESERGRPIYRLKVKVPA